MTTYDKVWFSVIVALSVFLLACFKINGEPRAWLRWIDRRWK